jgi:phenazine biosynthesis protein phzE
MSFTTNDNNSSILKLLLNKKPPPFAIIHRPEVSGKENIDVMIGDVSIVDSLDEIELQDNEQSSSEVIHDMLVLLPYRLISQRGFEATDDGTPLIVMNIRKQEVWKVEAVIAEIPDTQLVLGDAGFGMADDAYEAMVRDVLEKEIGRGKGASFVLQRSFTADITTPSVHASSRS